METVYRIVFVYPDGHLEDIQETFHTGAEALDYGQNLLGQVFNTEKVLNRRAIVDVFDEVISIDPYFMIIKVNGKKYHLVYDSRGHQ